MQHLNTLRPVLLFVATLLAGCDSGSSVPGPEIDTAALQNADPIPPLWTVNGASLSLNGAFESPCQTVGFNGRPAPTDSRWLVTFTPTEIRASQATYATANARCENRGADIGTYTLIATGNEMTTVGTVAGAGLPRPSSAASTGPLPESGLANRLSVTVASTWLALPLGSRGTLAIVIDDSLPASPRLYFEPWQGSAGFSGEVHWTNVFSPTP